VRNTVQGVSGSMGTYTWDFYPEYLAETFQPGAAVMIVLAVVGATRLPALAVAVVVTVAVHSLVPHKEFRFVYLAVAASPILIGAGASALFCRIRPRAGRIATAAVLAVTCLLSAAGSYATATHGQLAARWVHNRDYLDAFLAAHRAPDLCALGVSGVHRFRSGGYAYLDRQVPLYYSDYEPVSWRPGATVPMRLEVVLAGRPVSEPAKDTLALASARFNYLVAPPDGGFDGFTPTACFDTDDTPVCLFRRPGGCDP